MRKIILIARLPIGSKEYKGMFTFQPWMKTALIVIGIVVLIVIIVFLYLLVSGADESRKKDRKDKE